MKTLKLALLALLIAPSAFAASIGTLDIGRERALQECGGSIEANISDNGKNEQLNLALRNVKFCSNFIIEQNGKEYKIPGRDGDRTGSFTIPASDFNLGINLLSVTVRSGSGKHSDFVLVPVRRTVLIPLPQPAPVPAPRYENAFGPLAVGDSVITDAGNEAQVIGVQTNGTYVIKFTSGVYYNTIETNRSRDGLAKTVGCSGDLCVNDSVITVNGNEAKIIAIRANGNYAIKFTSGVYYNTIETNRSRDSLAKTEGCAGDLCVNNAVITVDGYEAKIIAIQYNGYYIIKFTSGIYYNTVEANRSRDSLAKTVGCSGDLCVNDSVITVNGNEAKIIAIQYNGYYVIKFTSGVYYNTIEANRSRDSILRRSR